jgi:alpha-tubulin suppressor-like RCC1 family protein
MFAGACTVDPVSSIPNSRFQCDDPALCPPDSGVKDIPDRVIDMSQDADTGPEQDPDASDTGFPGDGFLDAQDMGPPDQGFMDPADAGFPDGGRDAGIGFDVGTSTSCDWLSSTGSGDCDGPVSIETGEFHTCAIRESGSVVCWGRNTDGQLGDGTNQGRSHPVTVLGLTETGSITIGAHHTCALENGAVWCWGRNELGQLGVSDTLYPNISYPVQVLDQNDLPLEGVAQIDAGDDHTCALKPSANSKDIYCWGDNAHLQAGLAETFNFSNRARPVQLAREYFSIGVGGNTTCALAYDNNVENGYCWGQNDYGQTGTGTISRAVPVTNRSGIGNSHREALFTFAQYVIKVGKKHACIRNQYGNLFCWGDNRYGQVLAHQSTAVVLSPQLVMQPGGFLGQTTIGELVLGDKHSCTDRVHPIWGNSGIVCWGNNDRSQLAFLNTPYSGYPWRQNLSQRQFPISLSAGGETTCAITNAQRAFCWGDNKDNELGDGSLAYANHPILVPEVANVTSVESGNGLTCITRTSSISNDEFTQCWGRNDFGQLGNGNQTQTPTPQTLNQVGQLSAGTHHVCQMSPTAPGVIGKCWGNNQYGQLSAEELRLGSTSPIGTIKPFLGYHQRPNGPRSHF